MPLHYPSMYQDMIHDRPTEVDYINGYIAKLGREHNYEAKPISSLTNLVHLAEYHWQMRRKRVMLLKQKRCKLKPLKATDPSGWTV